MVDGGAWGVAIIFAFILLLFFVFMLFITRKFRGEEYSEWQKEMDEWRKAHPVWHFLSIFPLIGPFFSILHWLVGPPLPKRRANAEVETIPTDDRFP